MRTCANLALSRRSAVARPLAHNNMATPRRTHLDAPAHAVAEIVFGTDELRECIFDQSLEMGSSAAVAKMRFGRIACVCKAWRADIWGRSPRLLMLLSRLAAEQLLPVARLAVALSLPQGVVRSKYMPAASPAAQVHKLSGSLPALLRDHGGWAALRQRSAAAAQQAIIAEREAAAARVKALAAGAVSRVQQLHNDLKEQVHAWETAKRETVRLATALRAAREAEASGERSVAGHLSRLERERMTLSSLQATQIGATVNGLRKSDAPEVAATAKRLVTSWKAVAGLSGRAMDPANGVVDTSGKKPVPPPAPPPPGLVSNSSIGSSSSGGSSSGGSTMPISSGGVNGLRERYAQIEAQKRARQIVTLSAKEAPRPKKSR
jgi:hypothetical protein